MPDETLESRVAALEETVAQILAKSEKRPLEVATDIPEDAWERTIGVFDGDPLFDEIVEEGRRIREADRSDVADQ